MGRRRRRLHRALPIRGLIPVVAFAFLLAACTNTGSVDGEDPSSTSAIDPTTTSTTVEPGGATAETTTTTTTTTVGELPRVADPEPGVMVTFGHRIEIRPTDGSAVTVVGDETRELRIAFDDLNGGVVYQYRQTPPDFGDHAVLHLPIGASAPQVLLTAGDDESVELVDVGLLGGLVTVVVLARSNNETTLLGLPLAGGAPVELLEVAAQQVEPPADNEFLYRAILGGTIGGDLIGHLIASDGGCAFVEARRIDSRFVVDPLISACDTGAATLVDLDVDGTLLAYLVESTTGTVARAIDLDRMAPTGSPTIEDGGTFLDLSNGTAIISYADGYALTDFEAVRFVPVEGDVQAVTALREVPTLGRLAFLGGFRTPEACSGQAAPLLQPQDLPRPVDSMRTSIGETIRGCDWLGLLELTGPDFTASLGGGAPLDLWARDELRGVTPLADIANTLQLPFTILDDGETDIYVWPSAVSATPDEEDWVALEALYNEEEIELWRTDGYTGLRVGITAAGVWIFAVAGD